MSENSVAVDKDVPPAGTACVRCATLGHFCAATEYIDDTDEAQCHFCLEAEDCPVIASSRSNDENSVFKVPSFPPEERIEINKQTVREYILDGLTEKQIVHKTGMSPQFVSGVVADVKRNADAMDEAVIAREAAPPKYEVFDKVAAPQKKAPSPSYVRGTYKKEEIKKAKELLTSGVSVRDTAKEAKLSKVTVTKVRKEIGITDKANAGGAQYQKTKFGGIIGRLSQLKPGEAAQVDVTAGRSLNEFAPELLDALMEHPKTQNRQWIVNTNHQSGRVIASYKADIEEPEEAPVPLDITVSRAFEIVMREMRANLDTMADTDDEEVKAAAARERELVNTLHDWHPAFTGMGSSAPSIYRAAMERASSELHIIELELRRLTQRRDALKPILSALQGNIDAEESSA